MTMGQPKTADETGEGARAKSAFRRHLPGRTVRLRLTLTYGGLFLASGAVLLVITGLLWGQATASRIQVSAAAPYRILSIPGVQVPAERPATLTVPGQSAPGIVGPYGSSQPVGLVFRQLRLVASQQRSSDLHQLLLYSAIALGIMAMLSIVVGWLIAGRVLRPLHTITSTARDISASNLHERLDLHGPDDELKELGDTFDQLLERLERAFRSQRQFVANASHELRTPLATMRARLDVALAKPGPVPPETIALADHLHQELDHVDQLLESFLALARAQRGPADEEVLVSPDVLAARAIELRATSIADLALEVSADHCPEVQVAGNETLLARMVDNVIDNAVDHNERGGWIRVRTEVRDGTARLIIENGGPVLDADAVTELIQPFRRLGAERTGSDAGFGLGLSIVAAIAETHGGRLELRALDRGGLQVLIELPLAVRRLAGTPA